MLLPRRLVNWLELGSGTCVGRADTGLGMTVDVVVAAADDVVVVGTQTQQTLVAGIVPLHLR